MAQDFIDVQKYLSGMSYPATKEQLVEHAKEKGAPENVLDELARLPEGEYDGPNRVSSAVAHT
ncbi:DUF2795 domain-containing protein [Actinoallomurus iriomotensis]|uniref:DUF2795 domain-containing protein n=1 Tax=Actinoallomurus iriomotensis TaxID=478107 RepID=A0A9W6SBB5_9ACTN|nr:DUF2795 domain-containing protein [Actinoallomurus iriomotensis]GLY90739.1 hypothetical protein Airi02_086680 [Actinoallomurus iriomotensis]